ncbi:ABC transporter ATP-binding protein [Aneurinibacillus terranovensis]|uniref:ABC transporter ATP-binding protein n=1 Tax=Aneurinibacillus terranovensis TaxID=278991 RepID=UPI0003FF68D7|nr:ABC transporter ATP-binding protein [Aneurinibacillus terranovensis]
MIVTVDAVSWRREEGYILQDVSWKIEEDEHWAIIGLNGSGKTTLLNILNGYIWPTKGSVEVLGNRFGQCDVREVRKSIGWVSSSLQDKLYRNETVENIVLSGKFASIGLYDKPLEADYEKARALLTEIGCESFLNRPYQTLSQGEKQKVLIARALIASPKLLILDEPCTGLDIFAREQLLHTIQKIGSQPEGPTLIYVSHHIEEIVPAINHALLLKSGSVYAAGNTHDVLTGENLSKFFENDVNVDWENQRPWLRIQS